MTVVIDTKKQDLTNEEIEQIKEYHRKKLREAIKRSQSSLKDIPELEQPSEDQKDWFIRKMKRGMKKWT